MEHQVWFNGQLRPHAECTVSVRAHALHYGSSVFEGIRAYDTHLGTRILRLTDHLERMYWSAGIYRINIPYSLEELHAACRETVKASGLQSAYLRPIAFRGDCGLGVIPNDMNASDIAVLVTQWGAYLGEDGLQNGIKACITSWQRVAPNTIPAGAKAGGNYLSSQLIGLEARDRGFEEGIALGTDGLLSEGTGENVFMVRDGVVLTPPSSTSILSGITRDSAIKLAADLDIEVREQSISREQLYAADEVFFTGTAVEITPVIQIDHMAIGNGKKGPLTSKLQDTFFGLFDGRTEDSRGWLEAL
ncbi:MAG: branched-chain amino acid transaminase [Xanthomonadales bacterium]|nr:branched-chain amino acid transaminase [Gammaproteobacteria bacterium]NNE05658.1 branched-chain amino acid transaminase [Xanthomonadales bacterium]NNL96169.1 branched-chain amino acid transaminase [Xanthomonadales bacterium]